MKTLQNLVLLAAILAAPSTSVASSNSQYADIPIAKLIDSAKAARAQGNNAEALNFFDAAAKRNPSDYMTLFQRGATYLSLGRSAQAKADFDGVLKLKPGFEGALKQRAKIHARNAEWVAAKDDYKHIGKKAEQELGELEEAEGAAYIAAAADKNKDWEACVQQATVAINVAGTSLPLRQLRARCRFERGEIQEGLSDLQHVLQMHPGDLEPHLQISAMLFYSLADTERGLSQVKRCLQSDPDFKSCRNLHKQEKRITKFLDTLNNLLAKGSYASAAKILTPNPAEEEEGLLAEVKADIANARQAGTIHEKAGSALYMNLVEKICECYVGVKNPKKAEPYCKEALDLNPTALYGLLHQAQTQIDVENYDAAIGTLNTAKEHHGGNRLVQEKLQEAQVLLKRSKTKDYYKVLGVPRNADEATIKKAYRKATKEFHPDKAMAKGVPKEEAEKKMASINEAYEVLSDPELRQRFDQGEDPNDPHARQGGSPFHGSPFGDGQQQFVFRQGGGQQFQFKFGGGGFPF